MIDSENDKKGHEGKEIEQQDYANNVPGQNKDAWGQKEMFRCRVGNVDDLFHSRFVHNQFFSVQSVLDFP